MQWRKFDFFDSGPLQLEGESFTFLPNLVKRTTIHCIAQGFGALLLADNHGFIYAADEALQVSSFSAYTRRVSHMQCYRQREVLITVGEEEESLTPVLKAWNMAPLLGAASLAARKAPLCVRTVRLGDGGPKAFPVTCLAVYEDPATIAVGFLNGTVISIRGDVVRDRFVRQRVLHESEAPLPIAGLALRGWGEEVVLFVVTPNLVHLYNTLGKERHEVLDDVGTATAACVCESEPPDTQLVMGRTDAVYFYGPEGRGSCLAFKGDKSALYWFRNYLVVTGRAANAFTLTVYDTRNRFIAFQESYPVQIKFVAWLWRTLFVILVDGSMFALSEKDSNAKLDMLFKRNLYEVAVSLAANDSEEVVHEIYRKYGDHLYGKGDFDGAVKQYCRTIGHLAPSYVIAKYLDSQRIGGLAAYLQALHDAKVATADHTTLLLHCFTKMKDTERLNRFVHDKDADHIFDVENAITVCRQARFYEQASYLAKKYGRSESYVSIQLTNLHAFDEALAYLREQPIPEAQRYMKQFGKLLVGARAEGATQFLVQLCTSPVSPTLSAAAGSSPTRKPRRYSHVHPSTQFSAEPDEFLHIFVAHPRHLLLFLESVIRERPVAATTQMWNTLLELYLTGSGEDDPETRTLQQKRAMDVLKNHDAKYDLEHAVVLCRTHDFSPGLLHLYIKMKMYREVMQFHLDADDREAIVECCERYGEQAPELWGKALGHCAMRAETHSRELAYLLEQIDKRSLLPPVKVVRLLARSPLVQLGSARAFLGGRLSSNLTAAEESAQAFSQYRETTEGLKREIATLTDGPVVCQPGRCAGCQNPIELPAVYFMCKHTFHAGCLRDDGGDTVNDGGVDVDEDGGTQCPKCEPEHQKLLDIRASQRQTARQHDTFFRQLEGSRDGFSVVADYLGRNVFDAIFT